AILCRKGSPHDTANSLYASTRLRVAALEVDASHNSRLPADAPTEPLRACRVWNTFRVVFQHCERTERLSRYINEPSSASCCWVCHELQLPVACVLRSDCASEPTGASPPQPPADRALLAPAG